MMFEDFTMFYAVQPRDRLVDKDDKKRHPYRYGHSALGECGTVFGELDAMARVPGAEQPATEDWYSVSLLIGPEVTNDDGTIVRSTFSGIPARQAELNMTVRRFVLLAKQPGDERFTIVAFYDEKLEPERYLSMASAWRRGRADGRTLGAQPQAVAE